MALNKVWRDRPAELAPRPGETLAEHEVRVAIYAVANPGVLTPLDAAAQMDLEARAQAEVTGEADARAAGDGRLDVVESNRTLKAHLPVQVDDHGAAGDGVADDTAGVQAAWNAAIAAGRQMVAFTPGKTYLVTALTLVDNVYFVIPRTTTVKLANGSNANLVTATSKTNCGILGGGTLDANQANQSAGSGVLFTTVTKFKLDVVVKDAWNNGVLIDSACSDGEVDVTVYNAGSDAIQAILAAAGTSGCHGVALSSGCTNIRGRVRVKEAAGSGLNISDSYGCSFELNAEKATTNTGGYAGLRFSNGARDNYVCGTVKRFSRGVFCPVSTLTRNNVADVVVEGCGLQGVLLQANHNTVRGRTRDCSQATIGEAAARVADASWCVIDMGLYDSAGTRHQWGFRETGASNDNTFGGPVEGFTTNSLVLVGTRTKAKGVATSETVDTPSGATMTLRGHTDWVNVTGLTGITTINGARMEQVITLKFNGSLPVTHGTGNLRLAGAVNFAATDGDTLTLRLGADGNLWEIGRVVI